LRAQFVFEGAVAGHFAAEAPGAPGEAGTGGDEVGESLFLDEAAGAEDQWRLGLAARHLIALDFEAVVNALDFPRGLGKARRQPARAEIAHRDDENGVPDQPIKSQIDLRLDTKDVIGMSGETESEVVTVVHPPADARADAGKMRVCVPNAGCTHPLADVGRFVNAHFIRPLAPMPEAEDDLLRKPVGVFFPLDDLDEFLFRRQKMNAFVQVGGKVTRRFVASITHGKDKRLKSLAFHFEHFADAERLRERGKPLVDIGEMMHATRLTRGGSSLQAESRSAIHAAALAGQQQTQDRAGVVVEKPEFGRLLVLLAALFVKKRAVAERAAGSAPVIVAHNREERVDQHRSEKSHPPSQMTRE
jgi:hypothetical protein